MEDVEDLSKIVEEGMFFHALFLSTEQVLLSFCHCF